MIKVLICEGNGTLELPNPSQGTLELLRKLDELGITLAIASNASRSTVDTRLRRAGIDPPETIVTRQDVGVSKPSPRFIEEIQRQSGVQINEMAYLGDDDRTDTFAAINAGVLPFVANYSRARTPREYGLSVPEPKALHSYLLTYGQQQPPYFGWRVSETCNDTGKEIDIRALIYQQRNLRGILERVLKDHEDIDMGSRRANVKSVLFHYLVSQCYMSSLINDVDTVTVYPGHAVDSENPTLEYFSNWLTRIFDNTNKFIPDLLLRHKTAPKSQFRGSQRDVYDQFRTIMVNPEHRKNIRSKEVLVIDDFTTYGYSLETARRMLIAAGAAQVVGIAVAKFRRQYSVTEIDASWDPYAPCTLSASDIRVISRSGRENGVSDNYFHNVIWPHYSA